MVVETQGIAKIGNPDEDTLGPAMLALKPAQRRFVLGKLSGLKNLEAIRDAGYKGSDTTLAPQASKMTHDPRIMAAIREVSNSLGVVEGIPTALRALIDIAGDVTREAKDRNTASKELLDRFGFSAKTEHNVTVATMNLTPEAVAAQLAQFAEKFGHDPVKVIDSVSVVEGEFEDVKEFDPDSIEDLL